MTFDENYKKLPKVYKRAGKECYLDPIRNKLIQITPEETVRQRAIQYLLEIGCPSNTLASIKTAPPPRHELDKSPPV